MCPRAAHAEKLRIISGRPCQLVSHAAEKAAGGWRNNCVDLICIEHRERPPRASEPHSCEQRANNPWSQTRIKSAVFCASSALSPPLPPPHQRNAIVLLLFSLSLVRLGAFVLNKISSRCARGWLEKIRVQHYYSSAVLIMRLHIWRSRKRPLSGASNHNSAREQESDLDR
jgi:hypothetical protein